MTPLRDDEAVDRVLAGIRDGLRTAASPLQVFAAVEGEIVEVQPSRSKTLRMLGGTVFSSGSHSAGAGGAFCASRCR